MDDKTRKKIDKKVKDFMRSARAFLSTKAGGEIPEEWNLSLYMLEVYFKQFLEINEEISALDSIVIEGRYGPLVSPLCNARDKACVRLESLMKSMGMTLKAGKQLGTTDVKKAESPLDQFMKKQIGGVETR